MPRTLPRRSAPSKRSRAQRYAHRHGRWAEKLACLYMLLRGYRPLAQQGRVGRLAQTDLLLVRGRHIVLAEVKFRRSQQAASMAVGLGQQQRLRRQALAAMRHYPGYTVRVDVVWVLPAPPFFRHIPNAVSLA